MTLLAGLELGGTKCIAVLAEGDAITHRFAVPTGHPDTTLPALRQQLQDWQAAGHDFAALGIASFGPLGLDPRRPDFGQVTVTPKTGWSGTDLLAAFAPLGRPLALDTDVNGAALAEGRRGTARGCSSHVYLTIGTGIGGGLVVNDRAVHGLIHPEIGHIRVRRLAGDPFPGICPWHGDCLEGLASGPAIAARAGSPAETLAADHPVWDAVAADLAEALAMLLLTVSPQRILIGGGVGIGQTWLLPRLRAATAERLAGYLAPVTAETLAGIIMAPALGADAGPWGAIALAEDALSRCS